MAWPVVSLNADKELGRYVLDEAAQALPLELDRQAALQSREGIRALARALYEALAAQGVVYALEPFEADTRVQHVRPPEAILGGAREGTCLDLALLYAGLALGKELVPLVVALESHALVAISLEYTRRSASDMARQQEGDWIEEGLLKDDGTVLRRLVDGGHYLAVECTGFAQSAALPADVPEGAGRIDGRLSFDAAIAAGRAQLGYAPRPFRFAVDVAVLRDRHGVAAYEAPMAGATTPYRHKVDRLMARETLFGGRDEELTWLDDATAAGTRGHVLVTGAPGTGKTALLVRWVRRLLERPGADVEPDLRVVYVFINRQAELDDQAAVLHLLCQQLLRAHGLIEKIPADLPALEARCAGLMSKPLPAKRRAIVVIDGLDEAEAKGWNPKFLLPRVPAERTHVVFSARTMAGRDWVEWLELAEADVRRLPPLAALQTPGVEALLREAPGELGAKSNDPAFVDALHTVSGGDPMYLSLLVKDLMAAQSGGEKPTIEAVNAKPKGLDNYLKAWWNDLAAQGKAEPAVRDLLGYLLVARGALSREVLIDIDDNDRLDSLGIDDAIERIRRYVVGDERAGFRLGHPRLGPFLVTDRMRPSELRGVAEALARWCERAWPDPKQPYAAQHVIGQLREHRDRQLVADRSASTDRMLALVSDPAFRRLRIDAPEGLLHDRSDMADLLGAALDDPLPARLPALTEAVLATAGLQHTLGDRVRRIFDRAAGGDLAGVLPMLPTLAPDLRWQAAMLFVCCGLVAMHDRVRATELRRALDDVARPETFDDTLALLERRVDALLHGGPGAVWRLPYPPGKLPLDGVTADIARGIVTRMGGGGDAEHLAAQLDPSMIGSMLDADPHADAAPVYLAERDSPWLVANAVRAASGPWGMTQGEADGLIGTYIASHAANPYREYRLRSLWGVLGAVLSHPDPRFAMASARLACEAAAQPLSVDYREMLRLAGLGLGARAGDAAALATLRQCVAEALHAANDLNPRRTEADTWGAHARRLAALAEVMQVALGEPGTALLDRAHHLPFGYAGFQAPASLALADAEFICRPTAVAMVERALGAARRAAHNVQEARFCVLTTARVRTTSTRWRPGSVNDLAAVVKRFASEPQASEFAPRHAVGEDFAERAQHGNMLHLPDAVRKARTLETIARDVLAVQLGVLTRLNAGAGAVDRLAEVAIPDHGFAPLLATRLAAELLGRRDALGDRTAALIARLLPAAAADATALDAVMARLVLACAPTDPALIRRLIDVAPQDWMRSPIPSHNVEA